MAGSSVFEKLIFMNDGEEILGRALELYSKDLYNIASDIYDSCIEDYYAQYEPTEYDRHGDITGFNLYSANGVIYYPDSYNIDVNFDPNRLLKYNVPKKRGRYVEKRDKVLNNVMAGLRGGNSSKLPPGWPMPWWTTYPNQYSRYDLWESTGNTLDDIYRDFMANVISDTKPLLEKYIKRYM